MIIDKVHTVVTPGETIDVVVCERGIAVNPRRTDLIANLKGTGLPVVSIEELQQVAYDLAGKPEPIAVSDEVVAVIEYRDGSIIDVVRKPL